MASESDPQVELRLRAAVESSPSGLLMVDRDGRIVLVNREILRLFGYAREELLGQSVDLLVPARYRARHPTFRAAFHDAPQTRAMGSGRDLYGLRKDGSEVPIEIGLNPIETPDGLYVLSSVVDISARQRAERERHDLEEQLRQAQKMESLGRLAGGVAHDFNNLLGAIIGFAELVQEAVANQPQVRDDIASLLKSAQRGKEVVERILLFSRRNTVQLRPLDLARVVLDAEKLLRVSLPAGVDIRVHLPGPPCPVHADANSLHQVIMNLATNAAQAMPQGGRIDLALDALEAGDSAARTRAGLREMPYARLTLRDTGIGMDADTLSRAFEPFFTTKPPGHGTGLGLSIVHTIVRTHGGTIWLESEPGRGTTATCMLPLREAGVPAEAAEPVVLPAGHGERILLVDDEPLLLEVSQVEHFLLALVPVSMLGHPSPRHHGVAL